MMDTPVSWVAVIVAAIASVFWGWVWHTWVCNQKWAQECGMHRSSDKRDIRVATMISFVAAFLTAYVIHRLLLLAQAAHIMPDQSAYKYGFCIAFTVWIGFYVPMALHVTAWMQKNWTFFIAKIINQIINLLIIALILSHWSIIR